jgi:heptaprenyl diphosphate synthase
LTRQPGNRTRILAFFGALSLFLSTIEYLFPKPLPFFRLGLSNLPILLALDFMDFRHLAALTLLKILGQGLLNGTLASYVFLFSAAGSVASLLSMYALSRLPPRVVSPVGTSLAGALSSNLVQVALSVAFIFGESAWVIAPLFLGLGTGSGLFIGLFASRFAAKSRWLRKVKHAWTD